MNIGRNGGVASLNSGDIRRRITGERPWLSEAGPCPAGAKLPRSTGAALARQALHRRERRLARFEPILVNDATWSMLLELLIARAEGRQIPIKCLWIASGLPPSTALRTIKQLEGGGHVHRSNDPEDGRRQFIELSKSLAERLLDFLRETEATPAGLHPDTS